MMPAEEPENRQGTDTDCGGTSGGVACGPDERPYKLDPLSELDPLIELGMKGGILHRQKKYKEAIECYTRLLESDPDDKYTLCAKANALCESGRYWESLRHYYRLLELNPESTDGLIGCGVASFLLKEYENARIHLEKAYERSKDSLAGTILSRLNSSHKTRHEHNDD